MNMQFYVEKLSHSEEFKEFMKKNPDAYLCSGFFVIDKEPAILVSLMLGSNAAWWVKA